MHEYRQALRCVPGEYRFDNRAAAGSGAVPGPALSLPDSGFPHPFDSPAYARRTNGVPRQVSRHRGSPGDGQGRAQAALH